MSQTLLARSQPSTLEASQWPASPKSDNIFGAVVLAPTPQPLRDDPVQQVGNDARFQGTLAYDPIVKWDADPIAQRFMVLRSIGSTRRMGDKATNIATYPMLQGESEVFEPQLSPNGESLIFKNGYPDPVGYVVRLWDFKARKLQQVTPSPLRHDVVLWSPDSRYLAFIQEPERGKPQNNTLQPPGALRLSVYDCTTGKVRVVAQLSKAVEFVWTQQNTLLYSPGALALIKADLSLRSGIYSVAATGSAPKLLIPNGYSPMSSPDGARIAFFGWQPDQSPTTQPSLLLWSRSSHKSMLVRPHS